MARSLRVLVVGGGIGGLCLAQGLRKEGMQVAVYERDRTREMQRGYRIHINVAGSRALHASLPSALWDAFVATAGEPNAGFGYLSERMEELAFRADAPPRDPAEGEHPVSRVMLRRVLLAGLDDVISFGKEFVRYERTPSGAVTALFADGTSATGDVLIGADGVGSKVRQQYLPHVETRDLGVVAVGGSMPLTERTREHPSRMLTDRLNLVLPAHGCALFVAPFVRKPGSAAVVRLVPGLVVDDLDDHVFWAFIARRETYGGDGDVKRMDGAELHDRVQTLVAGWHPELRRLVAASDPAATMAVRLQATAPVARWATTNVTLLGDAIHTMPPLQGLGGNTALRDAHTLCRALTKAERGEADLMACLREYEAAMREYGFAAVARSRRTTAQAVSDNRVGRALFRRVLRVATAAPPPLKQLFFPPMGE